MKFSSAIVDVIVELSETKEKYAVQIETEKARLRRSGPSEKMETLMTSKNELDEKINDLSLMVQYLFKSVFVHRYRDVVPDIRSICVTEIGNWMRVYPALFLEDSYLKYIGWTLYDKQPEVRLKCINSILPLYERIELVDKLQLFTGKFKERLVSMVMDRETEVAIKACRLMTLVYTAFPTMLEKEDCIPLYETIYCSNRQLAVAAAEFINTKLFSTAQRRTGDVDMTPDNKQLINDLLTFYIEGEVHSHPAYLVDALMDMAPFIKDWNTMVDILLSDYSDRFDTQLVEIMTCSIKQAATGETPVGRSVVKRGAPATREQPRLLLEERTKISEVLIPKLPELLSKFIADQDKLINLTTIPLFFDLEIYPTARLTKHLDDLMNALERIVEQHTDDEVLRNVARVIMHFSTNVAVAQHTEPARLKLIDTISLQLVSGLRRFLATEERLDDEDEAALLASVRKMSAFNAVMDMRKWDVWDLTAQMLRQTHKFEGADLIDKGILLLYEMLAWDIKRIVLDGEVNRETIDRTVKRRDEFLDTIEEIMGEQGGGVETSYLCLCDALILLSWKLPVENPQLAPLVIDLNRQFIHRINMFVVDNVFVDVNDQNYRDLDEQAQIQLMYKKRNLLGQFCKLIIHGVLPVTDAALVLRNYISHYQDFGDMLKALLHKCRDIDRVGCARAMSLALVSVYDEIKTQNNTETVDPDSEQFENLKELAKKFAQSFGTDALKNRDALAMINKDGIAHALELQEKTNRRRNFRPANVSFLELLTEFSAKLLRQDKIAVLKYLEKHTPVSVETIAEDPVWQPYLFYKESLAVNKG
ncbi:Cohesin subunit SA-1 [Aphelenchoides avenae]|nr:Cohesin subunit SA-1 [Aphelenchus avenae]